MNKEHQRLVAYQRAILDRYGRSCTRAAIHLETEFRARCRGDRQSVPYREMDHALWIIAVGHGDVGKPAGLIDGCTSTDLVNLHEEPGLVLWLLQHRRAKFVYCTSALLPCQ